MLQTTFCCRVSLTALAILLLNLQVHEVISTKDGSVNAKVKVVKCVIPPHVCKLDGNCANLSVIFVNGSLNSVPSPDAFEGTCSDFVRILNFSGHNINQLTSEDSNTFHMFHGIRSIDLSSNQIHSIEGDTFEHFHPQQSVTVNLAGNEDIECNQMCELRKHLMMPGTPDRRKRISFVGLCNYGKDDSVNFTKPDELDSFCEKDQSKPDPDPDPPQSSGTTDSNMDTTPTTSNMVTTDRHKSSTSPKKTKCCESDLYTYIGLGVGLNVLVIIIIIVFCIIAR
jgi:hypothetical protein